MSASTAIRSVSDPSHIQEMNRFYVANRQQAVRQMSRLRSRLSELMLPSGITIQSASSDRMFLLRSAYGEIIVTDPSDLNFGLSRHGMDSGLARLSCTFDIHAFYYTEVVVQTMEELLEVIRIHLELQSYQHHRQANALYAPVSYRNHQYLPSRYNANHQGWELQYV